MASPDRSLLLLREQPVETWGPQVSKDRRWPVSAPQRPGFLPSQRLWPLSGQIFGKPCEVMCCSPSFPIHFLGRFGGWVGGLSLLGTSGLYLHSDFIHSLA